MKAYFNFAYNPVYDFTTARFNGYRKLQERCVDKLELEDNDRVLCIGLGTGNEIPHILRKNRNIEIVGVDYSHSALRKAYKKALGWGKEIDGFVMDARALEFTTGSFDKVLCIHVVDFVKEDRKVISEIIRVLKDGGQFVLTYPSGKDNVKLGLDLLRDSIRENVNSGKNYVSAVLESLAQFLVGLIYLPLLFCSKKRLYTPPELEAMIKELITGDFNLEENKLYHDFIIYGRK
jgi:ubiquinone/menaquinone biosynthesis C-methylase UbiE